MTATLAVRELKHFIENIRSYNDDIISNFQISLNLIGVFVNVLSKFWVTITFAKTELRSFSKSHNLNMMMSSQCFSK